MPPTTMIRGTDTQDSAATMLEVTPIAIGLLDAHLSFIQVNDAFAKLTGRPVKDHVGRSLQDVLPEPAIILERACREVSAFGKPITNLSIASTRAGVERW